jgi:benzodiazapine receptor
MTRHRLALILFVALVVGAGLAIGYVTAPGEWYARLVKPSFNPPNWVFAPVWALLYVLIAVAGWRVWRNDAGGGAMKLWWLQLGLNLLWSPVFFAAHRIGLALFIILLMLAAIIAFIALSWRQERIAAWLLVPYAAWVAFAAMLNGWIFALN